MMPVHGSAACGRESHEFSVPYFAFTSPARNPGSPYKGFGYL
jgi:hypothetical protein